MTIGRRRSARSPTSSTRRPRSCTRCRSKSPLTGTPSGFKDLDDRTGGFQPGNLIVIAARPSMGKSALVANVAENASLHPGHPVVLFSLEMSESELAQRFVASQARIPGEELRRGRVRRASWPKILEACRRLVGSAAVGRRLERHRRARGPRQGAPAAPSGGGRAGADHRRLPPADATRGPSREPRRAGGADLPRAQGAGPRAERARDRPLPAQPRGRAARRREEADPVRPA